jgi:hypothetical protein
MTIKGLYRWVENSGSRLQLLQLLKSSKDF